MESLRNIPFSYTRARTCGVILNEVLSELIEMLTGVLQACLLSPHLFLLSIDWIMRQTTEANCAGTKWTLTSRLDFADDIALLSHNHQGIQAKVTRLAKISPKTGLRISKPKTIVMRVKTRNVENIKLDGEAINEVEDFDSHYLAATSARIVGLIGTYWQGLGRQELLCNIEACMETKGDIKTKLSIFNTNVKFFLLYCSETWRATKETSRKLHDFVNKCLRSIMGIHWPEVIRNGELWERAEQDRIDT